jgi:hypothetical protein
MDLGPMEIEIFLKKMIQTGELLLGIEGYSRKGSETPYANNAKEAGVGV